MGYLQLAGSIACLVGANLLIKAYQRSAGTGVFSLTAYNILSSAAVFFSFFIASGFAFYWTPINLMATAGFGILMVLYNNFKIQSMSLCPLIMTTLAVAAGGVLIPAIFGFIALGEPVTLLKVIALLLVMLSFLPLLRAQKVSLKFPLKAWMFLGLIILVNGILGILLTVAKLHSQPQYGMDSMGMIYCFHLLATLPTLPAAVRTVTRPETEGVFRARTVFLAALSGIIQAIGNLLLMQAQYELPTSVVMPVSQSGILLFVSVSSMILYREKLRLPMAISMGIIILAIVLFAI
ncbi:MAG: hypothetical protein IJY82_07490 [Oscillospiraceae bacterium]|nr:hypothetical protein [Oscillospiraceae bacterium]MBQ8732653.1 hypothetical protein [Oscillospiraceae bacterium]